MTITNQFRVINVNSHEVLSLDPISTIEEAQTIADEIEQHETEPETEIQQLVDGEWVRS